jgi:3-isopropylmalate dehydrogenase
VKVVLLPGDGIGPEVVAAARRVLEALPLELELEEHVFGGAAIHATGDPLPDETRDACLAADAVVFGAAGLPEFDAKPVRPEQGILRLRDALGVYANLRPARGRDIDLLIVRELLGGLYYGPKGRREDGTVYDTCEYHPSQVERIARRAFEIARTRDGTLTSADKANVMETGVLWREVVTEVAEDYPDVQLRHMLADNVAMQLVLAPQQFSTIVTENTFGDILSDEAAGLVGGLGLAPSASLGDTGPGLYEPVHGAAPDIAGKGIANPAAMLWSVAMMLEHSHGLSELARGLERSVDAALVSTPTPDQGGTATTVDFVDAVLAALTERAEAPTL